MKVKCINVEGNDGSTMFHTGGVYTTQNAVNRCVDVTDDIGHRRVLLIEDGFAHFCIGHMKFAGGSEEPLYAHFKEV